MATVIVLAFLFGGFPNAVRAAVQTRAQHGWLVVNPQTQEYLLGGQSAIESIGPGTIKQ